MHWVKLRAHEWCGIYGSMDKLLVGISLKRMSESSLLSNHALPGRGGGLLIGPLYRSWADNHRYCQSIRALARPCPEDIILQCYPPLSHGSYILFLPVLSWLIFLALGGGDIDVSLWAEWPTVTYSEHSGLTAAYCQNRLFWLRLRSLLRAKCWGSSLTTYPFSKTTVVGSLWGSRTSTAMGFCSDV